MGTNGIGCTEWERDFDPKTEQPYRAEIEDGIMNDLTVDEKMKGAKNRAAMLAAEKHFFDAGQPHYPKGFSVFKRNRNHWDVMAVAASGQHAAWMAVNPEGSTSVKDGDRERAFRIRGEPGNVIVLDERWDPHRPHPRGHLTFRSITAAMVYISEELMQEPS